MVLARDPVCVLCRKQPSRIADHIEPLDPSDPTAGNWSLENGRGLCHPCHNKRHIDEGRM